MNVGTSYRLDGTGSSSCSEPAGVPGIPKPDAYR